jgi:hypothetical protein
MLRQFSINICGSMTEKYIFALSVPGEAYIVEK